MNHEETDEDRTSDYDSTSFPDSDFTSVSSHVVLYSYEYGRYQAMLSDRYGLPNDNHEQFRESLKHKMYHDYLLSGKHFISPVGDNVQKILDLGTGTGLWAEDVGDMFPGARVIGIDLSPIQSRWAAPNVEFCVEDLEDPSRPWSNLFTDVDFVHARSVLLTMRDPKLVLSRAFESLRPGGWLELHEILPEPYSDDGTVTPEHPFAVFCNMACDVLSKLFGWHYRIAETLARLVAEAGFVNINSKQFEVPIGRWPTNTDERELGLFNQNVCGEYTPAILVRHEAMGMTEQEAQKLGQDIWDAFEDHSIHCKLPYRAVWAQKPAT